MPIPPKGFVIPPYPLGEGSGIFVVVVYFTLQRILRPLNINTKTPTFQLFNLRTAPHALSFTYGETNT